MDLQSAVPLMVNVKSERGFLLRWKNPENGSTFMVNVNSERGSLLRWKNPEYGSTWIPVLKDGGMLHS